MKIFNTRLEEASKIINKDLVTIHIGYDKKELPTPYAIDIVYENDFSQTFLYTTSQEANNDYKSLRELGFKSH